MQTSNGTQHYGGGKEVVTGKGTDMVSSSNGWEELCLGCLSD